jgi:hypothetical protein
MKILWGAAETVSWIAYRDAQPIGNWGKFTTWSYEWPLRPPDRLLKQLETLARGETPEVPDFAVAAAGAILMRETGITAAILADALQTDVNSRQKFEGKINAAAAELQRAVEQQLLSVYAVQEGNAYTSRGAIDSDLFTRFPLSIHIYGRIAPLRPGTRYRGPCFEDAAFEPVDVRTLWPPPPPAAVPGAYDWLLAEATRQLAQHKRPANQADIVKRCVAAVGGQIRETTALHRTLPDELRYHRGKQQRKQR